MYNTTSVLPTPQLPDHQRLSSHYAGELLLRFADLVTDALQHLENWELYMWGHIDGSSLDHDAPKELWALGCTALSRLGELGSGIERESDPYEGPSGSAIYEAAQIVHETLERFCSFGCALLSAFLKEGPMRVTEPDFKIYMSSTRRGVSRLLVSFMQVHEFRETISKEEAISEVVQAA